MFVTTAQYASDALVHLGQAIGHAQRREAFTGAPGSERSHARHTEHLGYELAATTKELGHLATALRREHLASGYTYPRPAFLVTGIEPDTSHAKTGSAPEAPTRDAALRRSPIHTYASSTPDPAAGVRVESLQPARRDPRAGHR